VRVRRTAVPVLLWCLATAASIAIASLALRPVLQTAVPAGSVPLTAAEEGRPGGLIPPPMPTVAAPSGGAPSAASPSGAPASVVPSGALPLASAGSALPGVPKTSTTPTTAPAATPRVVDGWTVTTGGDGVDTYLRSFRSVGGDAVIRIRDAVVSLVTATPNDGFSVSRAQTEPTRLVVQFVDNSGGVAWLVDAMWWQNAPHGSVTRIGA